MFYLEDCGKSEEAEWYHEKKKKIINAVENNNVDELKYLLDSPKWFSIKDRSNRNLLDIAINFSNKEVFDYFLSIPNFLLKYSDDNGERALEISGFCRSTEYFTLELIKKGVQITDKIDRWGATLLHRAVKSSHINVIKKIISLGLNLDTVDENGNTPLDLALLVRPIKSHTCEIICILLMEGAEATVANFETSVMEDFPLYIQENLFFYSWHNNPKLRLDVILRLVETKSPLFDQIIKNPPSDLEANEHYECFQTLCQMDFGYLKIMVENFGPYLAEALSVEYGILTSSFNKFRGYNSLLNSEKLGFLVDCLENVNYLLENELIKSELVNFISQMNDESEFFETFVDLGNRIPDLIYFSTEKQLSEFYLFLLSYGLNLQECDLQLVYYFFGRCELFEIMLYMEFQGFGWSDNEITRFRLAFPEFLYKPDMVIEKYFEINYLYPITLNDDLFSFFAHPKLTKIFRRLLFFEKGINTNRDFFPMPSLIELARNSCREFLIKRYNIQNCREFYTILKWLPINNVLKKIINYEKKLYSYATEFQ